MPPLAHPGDDFQVDGFLDNPDEGLTDVPTFFILDVYGQLWFWPSGKWYSPPDSMEIDYELKVIPTGTTWVEVVPQFVWPDTGDDELAGLYFYGAMLNSAMNAIEGLWASVEWGYGPAK